jgi:ABC-type transporter Mla MlaB component
VSQRKSSRSTRARKGADVAARSAAPQSDAIGLPAIVGIRDAVALAARLRGALETGPLWLDGRAVEQIDTTGLQLLVAARRTATDRGSAFGWHGTSDALRACARRLGVAALLGLDA